MITGIGIDFIEVERVKKLAEKSPRFLEKVFTPVEIAYCSQKRNKYQNYAARFAAKEAFIKAYPGDEVVSLLDIEVRNEPGGRPALMPRNALADRLREKGISTVHLSLSHEREYGIACVVMESDG